MQSREEAAEARGAGVESGAQLMELARLQERASQLQGYELGMLDHAELMALIDQQMQARGRAVCPHVGKVCRERVPRTCADLTRPPLAGKRV